MKNFKKLFCILLCFLSTFAIGQKKESGVGYKGGFDSLSKAVTSNLMAFDFNIDKDYFLLFELSLGRNGKIEIIKPIHRVQDEKSERVYQALLKTSSNWANNSQKGTKIIVPVFLIGDKESSTYKNTYTITSKDYQRSGEFIEGFFAPPIIVNFYHQKN